jgi:linoleoyl-CoA desaturase
VRIRYSRIHRLQPLSNLLTWFAFASAINVHATGILDVYARRPQPQALPDRTWSSIALAHKRALRKFVRYYGREYLWFPLLAGPFFWKPLLGNVLSELARDLFAAATIYCGHVGAVDYPSGRRAGGRARWYVMQVEASRDFEVSAPISVLCGALNRQIEHHLFPRLPPNRLREIAPRVRAVCDAHGVRYRTDSWGRTLREVFSTLHALGHRASQSQALWD